MEKYREKEPGYSRWKKECLKEVYNLPNTKMPFLSPIDLNIHSMKPIEMPALKWYNYDKTPTKMKITNSGHTVIVSAKWGKERPYVGEGPLPEKGYVFSQMHFHWGEYDDEGSEHTVEGLRCPMEMHVVHFKSSYRTQESALKEKDGMITMVYFFKTQSYPNPNLKSIIHSLDQIQKPSVSARLKPIPLSQLLIQFERDYFLYWGSINTTTCSHLILWLICREPIGISSDQIDKFRTLSDASNGRMMRNYRETQVSKDSIVFHILPSKNITTTLLPVSEIQQQTNQKIHNSSHISAKSTEPKEVPLLPPGMFPREIFVQPSGMSYEEAYGYPGSSSQYLNQGHPIPFLIPIAPVSGSQYKNIYGYAPAMMYEYPADHSRAIYTDKSVGTSTAVETSESEIHRAKKNNRKLAKKTQVSSTMKGNKVSFEDSPVMPKRTEAERIVKERKIIEDQAISGKPHKIEREPRQRVQSRRESLDSSQNYESLMKSMQPICDMEKIEELGLTTQDILETRGWMFVKPYMEAALPTSCKEAKYYELGNNNQGAYS